MQAPKARLQLQPTIVGTDCLKVQLFQPMESWKLKKLKLIAFFSPQSSIANLQSWVDA